jgi:hypothetical protein
MDQTCPWRSGSLGPMIFNLSYGGRRAGLPVAEPSLSFVASLLLQRQISIIATVPKRC